MEPPRDSNITTSAQEDFTENLNVALASEETTTDSDSGEAMATDDRRRKRHMHVFKGLVVLAMAALILILIFVVRIQDDRFNLWLEWIDRNRELGGLVFVIVYATSVVFMVPAAILTLAAGAIFKFWAGVLIVWISANLGQNGAFVVARYLLRDWVESMFAKNEKLKAIDKATRVEAWKVVLLVRLTPVIPYSLSNYALAVTSVGMRDYTLYSSVGILPATIVFVYVGSTARDISKIINGEQKLDGPMAQATYIISGVLIIVLFVVIARISKRAMAEIMSKASEDTEDQERVAEPEEVVEVEKPMVERDGGP